MKHVYVKFAKAIDLLENADILLFRGTSIYSWFIKRGSNGLFSHVALLSRKPGVLNVLEVKEGVGGRSVSLWSQLDEYPEIDVFRVIPRFTKSFYNPDTGKIEDAIIELDREKVVSNMEKMLGISYGWRKILWMAKHKLLGFRLLYDIMEVSDDKLCEITYPVCSSAVAVSFTRANYDLIHKKADDWTEPSDFSKTGLTNYLFTITK